MTSKLKCPFCQTELEQMHDKKMLGCPKCLHIADGAFWKKAIQAKQDLEIARKALITTYARGFTKSDAVGILQRNNMTISKALKQIEHKEQQ